MITVSLLGFIFDWSNILSIKSLTAFIGNSVLFILGKLISSFLISCCHNFSSSSSIFKSTTLMGEGAGVGEDSFSGAD
jgi:hypothetical protein